MTKTSIDDLDTDDVRDLFGSEIYIRGEEYFENGCVVSIELINSDTIAGIVRGNDDYNVSVSVDDTGDIVCDCSCPCDFDCKHAAALLLKWLSVKGQYARGDKNRRKETLDDMISKKSKEELANILKNIVVKHPEFKALIKVEKREILSKVKALFSQFWDWDEVSTLISELETILEGIKRNEAQWDNELLALMDSCSRVMVKGADNVHDDNGDLSAFLDEWFVVYGRMFSKAKPSAGERKRFVKSIFEMIDEDEYGYDRSYEKALIGMCASNEDIALIKEAILVRTNQNDDYHDDYNDLLLELYDKLGMNDEYIKTAEESGYVDQLVDKLVSLNRLDEALNVCEKWRKSEFSATAENKRIDILRKLGRTGDAKSGLFDMLKKTGDIGYALRLKAECKEEDEWKKYLDEIIALSERSKRFSLLSRIYYNEGDFLGAYKYSESVSDLDYLEKLAKKLGDKNPELACSLFKRLCFGWIKRGSGWPYEKAGKMLAAIKKLDKDGSLFEIAKQDVIKMHKKKYSLMHILEAV